MTSDQFLYLYNIPNYHQLKKAFRYRITASLCQFYELKTQESLDCLVELRFLIIQVSELPPWVYSYYHFLHSVAHRVGGRI